MKALFTTILLSSIAFTSLKAQDPGTTAGNTGTVTGTYKGASVTYTTVRAADGNIWLQQNLGSTQVATNDGDNASKGDYFNWGRWDDGHQYKNTTSATLPSPNNPSGLSKVSANPWYTTSAWWSAGAVTDTWAADLPANVTATNGCDPCQQALGTSWHLPTETEFKAMTTAEGINSRATAFASNLKIPNAGYMGVDGTTAVGNSLIWTSTAVAGGKARAFVLANAGTVNNDPYADYARALGFRVRCVKLSTMPVNFMGLSGQNKNNYNQLTWATAAERNNSHFNLYKSIDGKTFQLLASVKGNGTTNTVSKYTYADMMIGASEVYYRLEQVDFNGATTQLQTISVKSKLSNVDFTVIAKENSVEVISNVNNLASVKNVKIYNINGAKLADQTVANANKIVIAKNLSKGTYVLQLTLQSGKKTVLKFSK